jgi:hypothetical protein
MWKARNAYKIIVTKSQENRVAGIIMVKSTCFIKYHGMRTHGKVEAQLHILTSALN